MQLTVLGSGCFAPPKPGGDVRNPAGYALRFGGRTLLFDFGFGNLRQLVRAGIDPSEVSHVFITHNHLDHVGDLPALLFYFRYEAKPAGGGLTIVGGPGFKKWFRGVQAAVSPSMTPRGYRLDLRELEPGAELAYDGFKLRAHKVPHFVPCQAYRLESGGRSFTYSGDTAYSEDLARFAAGSDLFVLECAQPEAQPLPAGHLTAPEAIRLAEAAGCRLSLLSHLSDGSAAEASRRLGRRRDIRVARDLQKVSI